MPRKPRRLLFSWLLCSVWVLALAVLDLIRAQIDDTEQGHGRLRRRSAGESAQDCKSEQRFFHYNYLLG